MATSTLYVGAWNNNETPDGQDGLWVYRFDEATGTPTLIGEVEYSYDVGALRGNRVRVGASLVDVERRMYHVTDERSTCVDGISGGGKIVSFSIDDNGMLTFASEQWSMGAQPSYLCFDDRRDFLFCSLLGSESATLRTMEDEAGWHVSNVLCQTATIMFQITDDGAVGHGIDQYKHGMDPISPDVRFSSGALSYNRPNPHSVQRAPGKNLFLVCDKGQSIFYWFRVDHERRAIVPLSAVPEVIDGKTGWGCRYVAWHPTKDVVYVNNEKEPLFTAWKFDIDGRMSLLQKLSPLDIPMEVSISHARRRNPRVKFEQQDLRISADGKYIYNCSRCADEFESVFEAITVFEVQDDATVQRKQTFLLEGGALWPRGAAISTSGKWLIVACVYSHEFRVLRIGEDGLLSHAGSYPRVSAANLCFLPS